MDNLVLTMQSYNVLYNSEKGIYALLDTRSGRWLRTNETGYKIVELLKTISTKKDLFDEIKKTYSPELWPIIEIEGEKYLDDLRNNGYLINEQDKQIDIPLIKTWRLVIDFENEQLNFEKLNIALDRFKLLFDVSELLEVCLDHLDNIENDELLLLLQQIRKTLSAKNIYLNTPLDEFKKRDISDEILQQTDLLFLEISDLTNNSFFETDLSMSAHKFVIVLPFEPDCEDFYTYSTKMLSFIRMNQGRGVKFKNLFKNYNLSEYNKRRLVKLKNEFEIFRTWYKQQFDNESVNMWPYADCYSNIWFSLKKTHCWNYSNLITLTQNGDIYPCIHLKKEEYKLANVIESSVLDLKAYTKKEECLRCEFLQLCGGMCEAESKKERCMHKQVFKTLVIGAEAVLIGSDNNDIADQQLG